VAGGEAKKKSHNNTRRNVAVCRELKKRHAPGGQKRACVLRPDEKEKFPVRKGEGFMGGRASKNLLWFFD